MSLSIPTEDLCRALSTRFDLKVTAKRGDDFGTRITVTLFLDGQEVAEDHDWIPDNE